MDLVYLVVKEPQALSTVAVTKLYASFRSAAGRFVINVTINILACSG
jgi:hypothetical protein